MELRSRMDRFRREHDAILRFLGEFQRALRMAHSSNPHLRASGLCQLREMEKRLRAIREHCREEDRCIESSCADRLDDSWHETLRREHEQIEQMTEAFLTELRIVTTPPPTTHLVGIGRGLAEKLRHHIAFEEGLLKQVEEENQEQESAPSRRVHAAR